MLSHLRFAFVVIYPRKFSSPLLTLCCFQSFLKFYWSCSSHSLNVSQTCFTLFSQTCPAPFLNSFCCFPHYFTVSYTCFIVSHTCLTLFPTLDLHCSYTSFYLKMFSRLIYHCFPVLCFYIAALFFPFLMSLYRLFLHLSSRDSLYTFPDLFYTFLDSLFTLPDPLSLKPTTTCALFLCNPFLPVSLILLF